MKRAPNSQTLIYDPNADTKWLRLDPELVAIALRGDSTHEQLGSIYDPLGPSRFGEAAPITPELEQLGARENLISNVTWVDEESGQEYGLFWLAAMVARHPMVSLEDVVKSVVTVRGDSPNEWFINFQRSMTLDLPPELQTSVSRTRLHVARTRELAAIWLNENPTGLLALATFSQMEQYTTLVLWADTIADAYQSKLFVAMRELHKMAATQFPGLHQVLRPYTMPAAQMKKSLSFEMAHSFVVAGWVKDGNFLGLLGLLLAWVRKMEKKWKVEYPLWLPGQHLLGEDHVLRTHPFQGRHRHPLRCLGAAASAEPVDGLRQPLRRAARGVGPFARTCRSQLHARSHDHPVPGGYEAVREDGVPSRADAGDIDPLSESRRYQGADRRGEPSR